MTSERTPGLLTPTSGVGDRSWRNYGLSKFHEGEGRRGARRGGAGRVGPPPRGVACACCAREATSWSPASSSSCSWMMLSRSKMARRLWPVRRMATRSGTLASATGAIHAALAALDEPPRELHRRIWSAQASVLLPIIDERRYEIVRENHGQISTHLNMDGDLTDPFDLDIGRLKGMVQRPGFSRHISNVVRRLHETRNDLAHLKPLGLSAIRTLVHV